MTNDPIAAALFLVWIGANIWHYVDPSNRIATALVGLGPLDLAKIVKAAKGTKP